MRQLGGSDVLKRCNKAPFSPRAGPCAPRPPSRGGIASICDFLDDYSPPNLEPAQESRNSRARVHPQTAAPAVAIGPHRSGGPGSGAKVIPRSDESRARAAVRSSAGLLRRRACCSSRNSKRPPARALVKTRGIDRSPSKLAAGAPVRPVRTATTACRGDRPAERSAPSCKRTPGRIDRGPSDLLVRRRVWPPARVPP